jgi:hypothetical protein
MNSVPGHGSILVKCQRVDPSTSAVLARLKMKSPSTRPQNQLARHRMGSLDQVFILLVLPEVDESDWLPSDPFLAARSSLA